MDAPKLVPQEPTEEKSLTLNQLLMKLTEADDDLAEFDFTAEADLIEAGRVKVDNYKYVLDKLEALEAVYDKWLKEYQAAKRTVAANRERLAKHLVAVLQQNGFDRFPGNQFQVAVQRATPAVELKVSEPNPQLKIKYPDYIRVKYEWDKTAIRDGLKTGDTSAAELAALKETFYARFSIKKEV